MILQDKSGFIATAVSVRIELDHFIEGDFPRVALKVYVTGQDGEKRLFRPKPRVKDDLHIAMGGARYQVRVWGPDAANLMSLAMSGHRRFMNPYDSFAHGDSMTLTRAGVEYFNQEESRRNSVHAGFLAAANAEPLALA